LYKLDKVEKWYDLLVYSIEKFDFDREIFFDEKELRSEIKLDVVSKNEIFNKLKTLKYSKIFMVG